MAPRDDLDQFTQHVDPLIKRGWKQIGGQLDVGPTAPPANEYLPRQWDLLVSFESLVAQPIEWQVNLQYTPSYPDFQTGFPPRNQQFGLMAGARELLGSGGGLLWTNAIYGAVAAKIELGGGPNARTIYTDVRPGRYGLGAQTFARVSLARWGTSDVDPSAQLQVQSSIVPSLGDVAGEPPTYTFAGHILQSGFDGGPSPRTHTFAVPPGAQWFTMEATSLAGPPDIIARLAGYPFPINVDMPPPAVPWHVPTGAGEITIENYDAECDVRVTFWVR